MEEKIKASFEDDGTEDDFGGDESEDSEDGSYDDFVDGNDEPSSDETEDQSGDVTEPIDDTAVPNPGDGDFDKPAEPGLKVAG